MTPMSLRRYDCKTVRDMLPLHVGGDLAARHVRGVDEHLHTCLNCFREFRELATMRGRLGVLAEEPLPEGILDGFTEEVMARIAVGEEGPAALPPGRGRVHVWPRLAAAAVLLVALTLGATHVLDSGDAGLTAPPTAAPMGTPVATSGSPVEGTPVVASPDGADRRLPGWPAPSAGPPSRGGFQNGLMKTASQGARNTGGWGAHDRNSTGRSQAVRKVGVLSWPPAAHQALPGETVRDLGEALQQVEVGARVFVIRPLSLVPMDLVDRAPRPRETFFPAAQAPDQP